MQACHCAGGGALALALLVGLPQAPCLNGQLLGLAAEVRLQPLELLLARLRLRAVIELIAQHESHSGDLPAVQTAS